MSERVNTVVVGASAAGLSTACCLSRLGVEHVLPGLYFCGFHVAATGMLREIAIEAKRIARSVASV